MGWYPRLVTGLMKTNQSFGDGSRFGWCEILPSRVVDGLAALR